jgi:hypothetical protein
MLNARGSLVQKPEGKRPFGKPAQRWNNITQSLKKIWHEDWIYFVHD